MWALYVRFYRLCAKEAATGTAARANALWWLVGSGILWGILLLVGLTMEAPTSVTGVVGFSVVAGIVSVVLAWIIIFLLRFIGAPVRLWDSERIKTEKLKTVVKTLEAEKEPKLQLEFRTGAGFVEETICGPSNPCIYYRVLVKVHAPVSGCQGRLLAIHRLKNGEW